MAQGKGRRAQESQRSRVPTVAVLLIILAVGAGAVWFFFLRDGLGRSVPEFSFELRQVKGAAVGGPPPEETLQEGGEAVRTTLDALYVAGFVDPGKWEDGTFPEALEQFDEVAAQQAEDDLQFLTLGDEATEIRSIDPALGTLSIRFLVDAEENLTAAVATTKFVADGQYRDGEPLSVRHGGAFYLRPEEDGRWLIVGYDVSGEVKPGARAGGPQPAPTGGSP
jgi:hypothetical protein